MSPPGRKHPRNPTLQIDMARDMARETRSMRKTHPKVRSFYAETLLGIPTKLGLSEHAIKLLKAYDEIRLGMIDEVDLGRKIRLSPPLRQTLLDTICQCTDLMSNKSPELQNCAQMVKKCTEMLKMADRSPPPPFALMKLPIEIRTRIYDLSFGSPGLILRQAPQTDCKSTCPPHSKEPFYKPINVAITQTCSRIRDEALPELYKHHTLSFNCTCSMQAFLTKSTIARVNVRSIRFHWRGPQSDIAIPRLMICPELKSLTIRISQMTTNYVTKREEMMRQYFTGLQLKGVRLADARGLDELLQVRGLEEVSVKHAPVKTAQRRTDDDPWALQRLLESRLLGAKPDGYGSI